MIHDLEQLGCTGFEDLIAALAIKILGVDVQVMGSGRDGGRDLYTTQPVNGFVGDAAGRWQGYTVVQVKHKQTLAAKPQDNARWLWNRIRDELDAWDSHPDRKRVPDNLLFVTNVPLTPAPDVGGHDWVRVKVEKHLQKLRQPQPSGSVRSHERRLVTLKNWQIWDRHKIHALLDAHEGIRHAFPAFLTVGDVFANLGLYTDTMPIDQLEPGLREHARARLTGDGNARFQEAGTDTGPPVPLHDIVVDLPVIDRAGNRDTIMRALVRRSERLLKPGFTMVTGPRNLLITGAPGNGKTTIARFLVQAYRCALLRDGTALSDGHRRTIECVEAALTRFGCDRLRHRRWPILIDLADWAQHGGLEDGSLLRWVATKVSPDSNAGDLTPTLIRTWLRRWPWLLVLDGLDEVSEPTRRQRLLERVAEFVEDAAADRADVLVVVTTRPMGYAEEIDPANFERLDLGPLEPDEAIDFGIRATEIRLRGDIDRVDRVRQKLRQAASDDNLRHLLRTPLQVLILAFIIDDVGTVAPYRYGLFWDYYATVYKREKGKIGGLHRILAEHEPRILRLHEAVGFSLHTRSERGDGSYAVLSGNELRAITWQILAADGFEPGGAHSELVDIVVNAATKRLVLIEPRDDKGYGFEVRSLQELMAARRLLDGTDEDRSRRLRLTAASPHWRNAWLFAAGQILAEPRLHEHAALVELIRSIDENAPQRLGAVAPIGHRLALDVIDDGMTARHPREHAALLDHALGVLHQPTGSDFIDVVRALLRQADASIDNREAIANGMRAALGRGGVAADTTQCMKELISAEVASLRLRADLRGLGSVQPTAPGGRPEPADGWQGFREEIDTAPISSEDLALLRLAQLNIQKIHNGARGSDKLRPVADALRSLTVARVMEDALGHLRDDGRVWSIVRDYLTATVHREPVAERLHETGIPTLVD